MGKKKREKSRAERKIKETRRERINRIRRIAFLTIVIVIGTVVTSLIVWQSLKDVSFEEAIKNPNVRERYLARIVKQIGKVEVVKEIIYVGTPEKIKYLKRKHNYEGGPKVLMAVLKSEEIVPGELRKKFTPEMIAIFPYAFSGEVLKTEGDFKSSLLHEYHHVKTYLTEEVDGIKISVPPLILDENENLFSAVTEMDAIREELKSGLQLSPSYQEDRYYSYLENYTSIWEKQWNTTPNFIQSLKIEFFEDWMLNRPELFRGESWYFQHPATGRKYYFSPDEVLAIRQKWQR